MPAGDDWVGLVQAFLYAGSARVLATAWPVADRPTASLMTAFYEELRTGVPEDVALARAQRAALRRAETGSPLYWAGFVLRGRLAGEDRRMDPVPLIAVAFVILATGCGSGGDVTAPGLRDSVAA